MTDERSALGARMAEAMGWEQHHVTPTMYVIPAWLLEKLDKRYMEWITARELGEWIGYEFVDAWMREQGYTKTVEASLPLDGGEICVRWYGPDGILRGIGRAPVDDEPLAAITAALEARE